MRRLFPAAIMLISLFSVACVTTNGTGIAPCPETVVGATIGGVVGGAARGSRGAVAGAVLGALPSILGGCDSMYENPYPSRVRISGRGETVTVVIEGGGVDRESVFHALAPLLHKRGFYPIAEGARCGRGYDRCRSAITLYVKVGRVFTRGGYGSYSQDTKYRVQASFSETSTGVVLVDGTATQLISIRSSGYGYGYGGSYYGRSYYNPETEAALRALPRMF